LSGERAPRELLGEEKALYGTLLRAIGRSGATFPISRVPETVQHVLPAMAMAFAMHEGGGTKLAAYPHFNVFGYKWIKGVDEGRYRRVSYAGNEIDLSHGDDKVVYRVFDSYDAALYSWRWAIFEGSVYEDLRAAYQEEVFGTEGFIDRVYARWSNNPNQEILSLYRDWMVRLRGGWTGTLVRLEELVGEAGG